LFLDNSKLLKDGTYVFVAKQTIVEASHQQLVKDFKRILSRSKAFQES